MEKRHIAILGSTGSIGRQALDVIRQHRDLFQVELLTANNSSDLLIQQAIEFDANAVVICIGAIRICPADLGHGPENTGCSTGTVVVQCK